jgi:hypothetical protein
MSNETPDAFYARLKPEGKRLMLSIDGGGAKGYMTLRCLAKLEEMTNQRMRSSIATPVPAPVRSSPPDWRWG